MQKKLCRRRQRHARTWLIHSQVHAPPSAAMITARTENNRREAGAAMIPAVGVSETVKNILSNMHAGQFINKTTIYIYIYRE